MFKSRVRVTLSLLVAVVLALNAPALPALAADAAAVDTTANQTAASGQADTNTTPSVPAIPEPSPVTEPVAPAPEPAAETTTAAPDTSIVPPAVESADQTASPVDTPGTQTTTGVNNTLDSTAASGNAAVTQNKSAGDATTGSATAQATVVNILQSATTFGSGQVTTFTKDITGDVVGDVYLDPMKLAQSNTSGSLNVAPAGPTLGLSTDALIKNDISLNATSGNATVAQNGKAGNATTGDANALLNMANIINSVVSGGQTFIGTINIYGNLNGDILLPQAILDTLLASNDPLNVNGTCGSCTNVNSKTSQSITNTINLSALSGDASVTNNRKAGDATSGDAKTTVQVLNLTNREITGGDAVLVFVNLLGKWVGMIVNAPEGATAAALGNTNGSVASDSCGCADGMNLQSNAAIENNVNLNARSGDASVTNNRKAGDATSGDASARVNLVNIVNSQLSFSNFLGILFINVFGSWTGSFGMDTAAGTVTEPPHTAPKPAKKPKPPVPAPSIVQVGTQYVQNVLGEQVAEAAEPAPDEPPAQPKVLAGTINTGNTTPTPDGTPYIVYAGCLLCVCALGELMRRRRIRTRLASVTTTDVFYPSV